MLYINHMGIDLGNFYLSLATIMILIGIGWFLGKIKIFNNKAMVVLSNLVLSVVLPVAFFRAFPGEFSSDYLARFLWGFGASIVVLGLQILIATLVFNKKFSKKNAYEYKFAFVFNNTSFIGYPLVAAAFGQDGLVTYAGFMTPWVFFLFTYGVWLFKKNYTAKDTLKALINPNIIGIVAGAILFFFSLQVPAVADRTLGAIAGLATPLPLFCIGFMLYEAKLKTIFKRWRVVVVCLMQLTIPPVLAWGLLHLVGAPHVVISVVVLMLSLPTAAALGLFQKKFKTGKDADSEAGEIVALSTILSAGTVPLLVWILL